MPPRCGIGKENSPLRSREHTGREIGLGHHLGLCDEIALSRRRMALQQHDPDAAPQKDRSDERQQSLRARIGHQHRRPAEQHRRRHDEPPAWPEALCGLLQAPAGNGDECH